MTQVDITAAEPSKAPSQPTDGPQPAQQNQQNDQTNNDQTNNDKPAQQK